MIQRGRKSAAKLAIVATLPGQRAEPPAELSTDEAQIWRATVATKSADWFTPDSWQLLTAYCRAAVMCRALSKQIAAVPVEPAGVALLDKLLAMRDREVRALTALARAMRLTQQSRLKAEVADTAHRRANGTTGGRKPWET